MISQHLVFSDCFSLAWSHRLKKLYDSDVVLLVNSVRNRLEVTFDKGFPALGQSILRCSELPQAVSRMPYWVNALVDQLLFANDRKQSSFKLYNSL